MYNKCIIEYIKTLPPETVISVETSLTTRNMTLKTII